MASPRHKDGISQLGAVWLSRLFHPFVISVLVLFLMQLLSGYSGSIALGWTVLSFAVVILPMLVFLLIRVRGGRYQDMDVSIREDRHLLYAFGAACFILLLVLLAWLDGPPVVQRSLQAAFLAVGVGAAVNRLLNKLSLHALTLAGSSILLWFVSPLGGILLGAVTLLVGWARVHLTRHTFAEVLWGWLVGAAIVGAWWLISANLYAVT